MQAKCYSQLKKCNPCLVHGVLGDVLESIGNMYNFTVRFDEEPSGKWFANGISFSQSAINESISTGLLKTFFFSPTEYDCAASWWLINSERIEHVDISWPFRPLEWSLIYNENTMDTRGGVLLRPFQSQSWRFIVILFLFGFCVILMIYCRYFFKNYIFFQY